MKCPICGAAVPDDSTFCAHCGSTLFTPNQPVYSPVGAPSGASAYPPVEKSDYIPPAPAQSDPEPEKKSSRFMSLLPWLLVCFLVLVIGIGGLVAYLSYEKKINSLNAQLREKDRDLSNVISQLGDKGPYVYAYDDIVYYAENYNIGGTPEFGASPAVLCMSSSDPSTYFDLNTYYDADIKVDASQDGDSVDAYFVEDNWVGSTQIEVAPIEPGVSFLLFSVEDGSQPEFGVIVIVTD